jgi:hypothetical protein
MRIQERKKTSFYFKIIGIIALLGVFLVWRSKTSTMFGIKISETKDKIHTLLEENKCLSMKIMDLIALNNLEETAKKKLGLITPKTSDIVIIEEGKEK